MPSTDALPRPPGFAWTSALIAGAVSASIDLSYVFLFYGVQGIAPLRILHSIASGWLGRAAAQSGWAGGALGLVSHYFILIVAAAICLALRPHLSLLRSRPYIAGIAVGAGIWLTMNYLVLPLSAAPVFHPTAVSALSNFAVHLLLLGPAITVVLARRARGA
jgi:hypothetical protein